MSKINKEEKMALNNMNDGVGKKIVEALKMQSIEHSDGEVFVNEEVSPVIDDNQSFERTPVFTDPEPSLNNFTEPSVSYGLPSDRQMKIQSQLQFQAATQPQSFIDSAFNQSLAQNLGGAGLSNVADDFEYPPNVAVLKQLIAKLPSGVPKQTGAMIIKQTMEALGISIGSVLQEAKQVQETLTNNSKECQHNAVEYRKQIGILEAKAQNYQRQALLMNDIINLFIQTR